MNNEWKSFLTDRGAAFDADGSAAFANASAEVGAAARANVVCALTHLSILHAHGPDALAFLNGQFTNDLRQVDDSHSQLSAYCTPKGRMLAIFRIYKRGEGYDLILPSTLAGNTLKRLRMFIMRSKVAIEHVDEQRVAVGYSGPGITQLLSPLLGDIPGAADQCTEHDDHNLLRLPGPHPRYLLVAPPAKQQELWRKLTPTVISTGRAAWSWFDIIAGLPSIWPATVEEFVPQSTNLELVGGVSFKKGCYPGQEIVARMHYLGKPKQRMYRLHLPQGHSVSRGDKIYGTDLRDQAAGMVVDAQPAPQGGTDMLAVVQLSSVASGPIGIGAPDGPRLTMDSLPYELSPGD